MTGFSKARNAGEKKTRLDITHTICDDQENVGEI